MNEKVDLTGKMAEEKINITTTKMWREKIGGKKIGRADEEMAAL
jgi:hypothetical protein